MKQSVRIIGGQFRGKILKFPDTLGLRPTSNHIRETLFNWLMHITPNARCLDAFAGSGALGLEAFSRGACSVIFTDTSPQVCRMLKRYTIEMNPQALQVIHTKACAYLANTHLVFDIIFLDPPFDSDLLTLSIKLLETLPRLKPQGYLYIETGDNIELNPEIWQLLKSKKTGQVCYALYQKKA